MIEIVLDISHIIKTAAHDPLAWKIGAVVLVVWLVGFVVCRMMVQP